MSVEAVAAVEAPLENAYSLLHLLDSARHRSGYSCVAAVEAFPVVAAVSDLDWRAAGPGSTAGTVGVGRSLGVAGSIGPGQDAAVAGGANRGHAVACVTFECADLLL